jgi:Ca2+-binding RTX toxin-like protein
MAADIYQGEDDVNDYASGNYIKMYGYGGDDSLYSNAYSSGFVKIYGGNGDDYLYYSGPSTALIKGQNGNDYLGGSSWDDKLIGGKGGDWLFGNYGNDILKGGKGPDHFGFNTTPDSKHNRDDIKDFEVKKDLLHFNTTIYDVDGMGVPGKIQKSWFVKGSKAKDDDDFFGYNKDKGYIWYDENANDPGGFNKVADVDPGLKIKYHHFILD